MRRFSIASTAMAALALTVVSVSGVAAQPGQIYWAETFFGKVQRANLDGSNVEDVVFTDEPRGLALDLAAGKLYYSETGSVGPDGFIHRSNLDGSAIEDVIVGLEVVQFLALDLEAGKIYWSDLFSEINRSNLDGSSIENLLSFPDVVSPTGIALDPVAGKMYWADGGAQSIRRANLDGSDVETLVSSSELTIPEGIALDLAGGKLYWADRSEGWIRRANLDGTGIEDLVVGLAAPTGLALDLPGGKMYWTDQTARKIQRANLDGTAIEDLVTEGLIFPHHIALALEPFPVPALSAKGSVGAAALLFVAFTAMLIGRRRSGARRGDTSKLKLPRERNRSRT